MSTCGEDCIYARVAMLVMIIVRLLLEEIGPCCLFLASGYPGNLGISKLDALIMMIV